jgi:hypothetical protein
MLSKHSWSIQKNKESFYFQATERIDDDDAVRPSWVSKLATISIVFGTESTEIIGRLGDPLSGRRGLIGLIVGAIGGWFL